LTKTKKKSSPSTKKKQNSSTDIPKPKLYPLSSKKPEEKKKPRPYHAAGVLNSAEEPTDYTTGSFQKYSPEVLRTHIPKYTVIPYNSPRATERKPMTAATIKINAEKKIFPKFFMNPYQDLDYMVLQDIYANSIAGRIIDRIIELVFSRGIKPVLKLRNPEEFGDEQKQQEEIEKDQEIIDNLLLVDEAVSDPDDEIDDFLDSTIQTKFVALAKNAMVYGRSMILKEFTSPIKLGDGNVVRGIPNVLKVINPRDMGIVEIDQESWKLKSVQMRFTSQQITPQEMIYMEHGSNNPVYNGLHYGFSAMQSMIGASRSLKQMIEVDFPTITKHIWSGDGFIIVKPQGTTPSEKQEELNQILAQIREGRWNGIMEIPEDVRIEQHDLNPKIAELVQLADFLIRHNIAQTGMPQAVFAQEKDSNRATLIGKIRLFMDGPAAAIQEWISNEIKKQWYMPNFRAIYGRDHKLYKKYKIEAVFEPLKIEGFQDNVDAVMKLLQKINLTDEAIGELLNIDEFADKVDPDEPRNQGGNGIRFTDENGKPFNMENKI
jgi:hypothetical protein